MKLQLAKEQEERLKSHQGKLLNHCGKAVLNNASSGIQASLSSISDGIKSTSEENEALRSECMRLKEQLLDALTRLDKVTAFLFALDYCDVYMFVAEHGIQPEARKRPHRREQFVRPC